MKKLDKQILEVVLGTVDNLERASYEFDWNESIKRCDYETEISYGEKKVVPSNSEDFINLLDEQIGDFYDHVMESFNVLTVSIFKHRIYTRSISEEELLDIREQYEELIDNISADILEKNNSDIGKLYPAFGYNLENILDETSRDCCNSYLRSKIPEILRVILNDIFHIIQKGNDVTIDGLYVKNEIETVEIEETIPANVSDPISIPVSEGVELNLPKAEQPMTLTFDTMISHIPTNTGKPMVRSTDAMITKYISIDKDIVNLGSSDDQFILENNLRIAVGKIMELDAQYKGSKGVSSKFTLVEFTDVNTFRLVKLSKRGNMLSPRDKGFVQIVFTQGRIDIGVQCIPNSRPVLTNKQTNPKEIEVPVTVTKSKKKKTSKTPINEVKGSTVEVETKQEDILTEEEKTILKNEVNETFLSEMQSELGSDVDPSLVDEAKDIFYRIALDLGTKEKISTLATA